MWQKIRSGIWETVKFIFITLVIVIPIRAYVAQPFIVSGASMDPTFHNNEYLIVDELSYHLREPVRGEVVVFQYPKAPQTHFIKRIIGLPGETIAIHGNEVTINGVKLNEDYIKKPFDSELPPTKLFDNEYFVMGDNRSVSLDSRAWGTVEKHFMTGRAFLRLFPLTKISLLPGQQNF
ncbi:signal peptidase I [Candidatus Nomurabacteria bacterium]|nr:signal peptidase I [Candidatus Nomurabacteria bacterium]